MSNNKAPEGRGPEEKSGRLGPLNHAGLDLDAEERRQQRDKGSSLVVTVVIAVLVLVTGAVFYILHERAVDRSQPVIRPGDSAATAGTSGTAPPAASGSLRNPDPPSVQSPRPF